MTGPSRERVLAALATVSDGARGDIVSLGMVSGLTLREGHVAFAIEVDPARARAMEPLRRAAETAVEGLPDVLSVSAVLTAHRGAGAAAAPPADSRRDGAPGSRAQGRAGAALLPGVRHIVAVASGKGGVGKSTVAANLALALARQGRRVGILDADIYGPSMPRMLGVSGRPSSPDGKILEPMRAHGVAVMSIGFLVPEETPMIWRGPMVMSALQQMMRDVNWGALDILVVDMPPGTGDAQLTMAQTVPLAGAVIVSTPQDIALLDARKGLHMFRKVDVPVLGIVENMSYFRCPHCGERTDVFGHGGARMEATRLETPFLGEIPLDIRIRETSDGGEPIVAAEPDGAHAAAFAAIAEAVWAGVEAGGRAQPRIVIE